MMPTMGIVPLFKGGEDEGWGCSSVAHRLPRCDPNAVEEKEEDRLCHTFTVPQTSAIPAEYPSPEPNQADTVVLWLQAPEQ